MINAMHSALNAYASIDPRDMRDAEFFCSSATFDELLKSSPYADKGASNFNHLFGRPIRVDESVPFDEVRVVVETEYDRMIRRAARDRLPVVVMTPGSFFMPAPLPPPDPTLRALLRHWWAKFLKLWNFLKRLVDISTSRR